MWDPGSPRDQWVPMWTIEISMETQSNPTQISETQHGDNQTQHRPVDFTAGQWDPTQSSDTQHEPLIPNTDQWDLTQTTESQQRPVEPKRPVRSIIEKVETQHGDIQMRCNIYQLDPTQRPVRPRTNQWDPTHRPVRPKMETTESQQTSKTQNKQLRSNKEAFITSTDTEHRDQWNQTQRLWYP